MRFIYDLISQAAIESGFSIVYEDPLAPSGKVAPLAQRSAIFVVSERDQLAWVQAIQAALYAEALCNTHAVHASHLVVGKAVGQGSFGVVLKGTLLGRNGKGDAKDLGAGGTSAAARTDGCINTTSTTTTDTPPTPDQPASAASTRQGADLLCGGVGEEVAIKVLRFASEHTEDKVDFTMEAGVRGSLA